MSIQFSSTTMVSVRLELLMEADSKRNIFKKRILFPSRSVHVMNQYPQAGVSGNRRDILVIGNYSAVEDRSNGVSKALRLVFFWLSHTSHWETRQISNVY